MYDSDYFKEEHREDTNTYFAIAITLEIITTLIVAFFWLAHVLNNTY